MVVQTVLEELALLPEVVTVHRSLQMVVILAQATQEDLAEAESTAPLVAEAVRELDLVLQVVVVEVHEVLV